MRTGKRQASAHLHSHPLAQLRRYKDFMNTTRLTGQAELIAVLASGAKQQEARACAA